MRKKIKLSIGSKITLGYIFILICVAVFLLVVTNRVASLQHETDFISQHDIEVHDLANSVEKSLLDMETGQRGYAITGDLSYLEPYNEASSAWETNYNNLYLLLTDNPSQQENLKDIRQSIEKWIDTAGKPVIDMKKNGREDEVKQFFSKDPGKDTMDSIRNKFNSFLTTEKALTIERVQSLEDSNEKLITTIYILWVIVAVLSIMVAVTISRNIVSIIKDVTRTIKEMAAGGSLDTRIQVRTNDEIADLGRTTNELLEVVQKQGELKDEVATMSTLLQNESTLRDLSEQFVDRLAAVLGVPYVVLYAAQHDKLVISASYAGQNEKTAKNSIAWGEGLLGQCAKDRKIITLDHIPDHYIRISSGLGSTAPSFVVVAPFIYEGTTLAVVEVAALDKLDTHQMEMFKQLVETASGTMHSVINRMEIQRLYMEAQTLNEELQSQSEELQVQTEELQVQSEELQMQTDELQSMNEKLEIQKDQAQNAAVELEKYAGQLETSSNYKSEFLANMSHELRTPLNSMLILSQILAENRTGNLTEEEANYASVINSSGTDLLHLINDILDLSKVEAGKIQLEISAVNMSELPESMERYFGKTAEFKSLQFRYEIAPNVPDIFYSDELRLHQIIRNLLSNAFKFTERGEVSLSIYKLDSVTTKGFSIPTETLAFAVRDTGIGISEDKQNMIFEAFKQADGATARKFGGTGLGLSISQQFAKLLGGELTVESVPGIGSTFTLYLPCETEHVDVSPMILMQSEAAVGAAPGAASQAAWSYKPEETGGRPLGQSMVEQEPLFLEETELFEGKKVLVVDDDIRNVYALANALERYNMHVLTAQNGYECLDILQTDPDIAIILMDIMMPEMDGYQTMKNIRNTLDLTELPIIALTAKAMKEDKDKCLAAGASDYLSKPLNINEVISRMKVWMTKSQME
ncbi:CHASE3 domain-containing protein [Paenibacillus dokdonensis]|uniref:CHASE3 domain-containing protein n=1 Tax=Paenibacillus dokdonensis TaxID=2567944 RepID=UPI0010A7BE44|nr:CHASE3 domain-containing protein [Paenibacillus dokdonensis]